MPWFTLGSIFLPSSKDLSYHHCLHNWASSLPTHFNPTSKGSMLLQNVSICLYDYTMSQSIRTQPEKP
jgi:hypothetical protein